MTSAGAGTWNLPLQVNNLEATVAHNTAVGLTNPLTTTLLAAGNSITGVSQLVANGELIALGPTDHFTVTDQGLPANVYIDVDASGALALGGVVTAPTVALATTSDTRVATTAFVQNAIAAGGGGGVRSVTGGTNIVISGTAAAPVVNVATALTGLTANPASADGKLLQFNRTYEAVATPTAVAAPTYPKETATLVNNNPIAVGVQPLNTALTSGVYASVGMGGRYFAGGANHLYELNPTTGAVLNDWAVAGTIYSLLDTAGLSGLSGIMFIGGSFISIAGTAIAQSKCFFNLAAGTFTDFAPDAVFNGSVLTSILYPQPSAPYGLLLVVGGLFDCVPTSGDADAFNLVAYQWDGGGYSGYSPFNAGVGNTFANGAVNAFANGGNGGGPSLFIGGAFTTPHPYFCYHQGGAFYAANGLNDQVLSLASNGSNYIWVGGAFTAPYSYLSLYDYGSYAFSPLGVAAPGPVYYVDNNTNIGGANFFVYGTGAYTVPAVPDTVRIATVTGPRAVFGGTGGAYGLYAYDPAGEAPYVFNTTIPIAPTGATSFTLPNRGDTAVLQASADLAQWFVLERPAAITAVAAGTGISVSTLNGVATVTNAGLTAVPTYNEVLAAGNSATDKVAVILNSTDPNLVRTEVASDSIQVRDLNGAYTRLDVTNGLTAVGHSSGPNGDIVHYNWNGITQESTATVPFAISSASQPFTVAATNITIDSGAIRLPNGGGGTVPQSALSSTMLDLIGGGAGRTTLANTGLQMGYYVGSVQRLDATSTNVGLTNLLTGASTALGSTDLTVNSSTGGTRYSASGITSARAAPFTLASASGQALTLSGGSVVAPTVTPSTDSSTKVATTAFVQSAIGAAAISTQTQTASPVTLTSASAQNQVLTGSLAYVVNLPDATTLAVGRSFIFNVNTGAVAYTATVRNAAGAALFNNAQQGSIVEAILLTNATAAGAWDFHSFLPSGANFGNTGLVYSGNLTFTGSSTSVISQSGTGNISISGPTLTGVPLAPTAVAGTNTTQIATTAFVQTAVSTTIPTYDQVLGAGSTAVSKTATINDGSTNSTAVSATSLTVTTSAGNNVVSANGHVATNGTNSITATAVTPSITVASTGASSVLNSGAFQQSNSNTGYTNNQQLTITNTNASAGATTGVPSESFYKAGRNAVSTDIIGSTHYFAKNAAGTKTEFARIEAQARNTAAGSESGYLGFSSAVAGASSTYMSMAGNVVSIAKNLDMNGNVIKSSTGNFTIDASASSGSGIITLTTKAGTAGSGAGLVLAGDTLLASAAGAASGRYLSLTISGVVYKIPLLLA